MVNVNDEQSCLWKLKLLHLLPFFALMSLRNAAGGSALDSLDRPILSEK